MKRNIKESENLQIFDIILWKAVPTTGFKKKEKKDVCIYVLQFWVYDFFLRIAHLYLAVLSLYLIIMTFFLRNANFYLAILSLYLIIMTFF